MWKRFIIPSILLTGLACGAGAERLSAQEPVAGVTVFRYFECGLADLGEAVEILNGSWRGFAEELVEQGLLVDYGILTHSWGDEWNLVDWFAATDQEAFHAAWRELLLRVQEVDPDGTVFTRFGEFCPRHKDNIYSVVPPS